MPRREFLYDIQFWEARRIVRGFRKRNMMLYQLLAENVYATTYMMRDTKGKKVSDMFPGLFDDDEDDMEPPISDNDAQELVELMDAINAEK